MASTIVTKNSSTASAVPVSGDLTQGELAVNVTDKRLFTKNSGGTVVELGTNPASLALPNGTTNGVAYLNGSKVVTTGSALTFNGTNTFTVIPSTGTAYNRTESTQYSTWLQTGAGNGSVFWEFSASTPVRWVDTSAGELMRLTSTGLGVGTSFPGSRLEISASNPVFTIYNTNTGDNGITWESDAAAGASRASLFLNYANAELRMTAGAAGGSYFQSFYTNGSERMRLDSSGNLGLGVTPSAWGSGFKAMDINTYAAVSSSSSAFRLFANSYGDGTNWIYKTTAAASRYDQSGGSHAWFYAPSGTAGNAITFTQAMTLDASGRLGIANTSPSVSLEIGSDTSTVRALAVRYSSVPAYLSNSYDGTVGLTTLSCNSYNTSNGSASWSSFANTGYGNAALQLTASTTGSDIRFLTAAAANTNPTERARIDSSGSLLVGTTNSSISAGDGVKILVSGAGPSTVSSQTTNSNTALHMYSSGASAYRFYVGWGGTIYATSTTISAISDQRLKENIRDLDVGLDAVMALKPRKFDWKEGKGADIKNARGFIAQEFEQVFPDLIDEWKDPAPEGEEPYKSVRADLIPVLVKAIQELKAEFDAYKATHP